MNDAIDKAILQIMADMLAEIKRQLRDSNLTDLERAMLRNSLRKMQDALRGDPADEAKNILKNNDLIDDVSPTRTRARGEK